MVCVEFVCARAGEKLLARSSFSGTSPSLPLHASPARIPSYPEVDIAVPFEWNATAAEVTERVRAAMEDR
jgi:hypothetical protein